ncbi:hypothetical protein COCC4DRAFT_193326 [Bipolaris maydis ATCC 48331]|uniref:Uncharacterized protein n=2 Tax=Cochliobolus heterostrophus TaxID=5016 RepID=M2SLK8_COCH5|nr:uncharacterized protein COCC4DRAFT_193326 [Bipolaris maydis ATCC 48331]EMD86225.1 hypothetical protein COCHEDRAFT_1207249 [Bipolaris maydis C5]KAH7551671.1 hypothetical protein BM1_09305 [Bipolaris maydis]ENI06173.1 hypothetical protein COCC4DRAFT_193326 [Bipolaris maydis ATCC 48331]KAJ5030096.1 hypothetical protein J3E73DRAFT_378163 [Bipolaris maydis]KAJ5065100.1 hypothetical protein J3E74DRAFT_414153 [Bipolaris maydis]
MIFGGLELVAGGYLLHRHYRKKNQANTAEDNAQHRRHHTFPSAICPKQQQQHHNIQHPSQPPQHHQPTPPHQKYAYYAIAPQPRPQLYTPQTLPTQDFHHHPPPLPPHQRPPPLPQTHSFTIPRRPVPERKPQIIIQPSLQRSDSFATLSRMPIANGSRPHDVREESPACITPTAGAALGVATGTVYGNHGYSMSTPAFGATATSPGLTYEMATPEQVEGWERYGAYGREDRDEARPHYAPTVSTELGERDVAPPPYVP